RVDTALGGVVFAFDCRVRQFRQGMADEGGIDSTVAVELFLEGKDYQRLVDVIAQQANPSLAPSPELRRNVIDDRNASLLHLPGDAPVESGRVDDDRKVRLALIGFGDQTLIEAVDFRQMAKNLSDADDREILRVDHGVAPSSPHALSAHPEEFD